MLVYLQGQKVKQIFLERLKQKVVYLKYYIHF